MRALLALLALLALAAAVPARAGEASAPAWELRFSTTSGVVGQTATLSGIVRHAGAEDLVLELETSTAAPYALASGRAEPGRAEGGLRVQAFSAEVLPLAAGELAVTTRWRLPGGETVESPAAALRVTEPALSPEEQELRDIKEPRAARPALWPWLLAAAAALLAWQAWKRLARRGGPGGAAAEEAARALPAEDEALAGLEALRGSGLWEEGRHKEFYAVLTDVLRHYLERRYDFPATRMTSAELLKQVRQLELGRETSLALKGLLDRADLVKFARTVPEPGWGPGDLEGGGRLVRETAPKPVPAEAQA